MRAAIVVFAPVLAAKVALLKARLLKFRPQLDDNFSARAIQF